MIAPQERTGQEPGVVVVPAAPADLAEAAALLAAAFEHEPQVGALLQHRTPLRRRAEHLYRALLVAGPLRRGTVDAARDTADGRLLGVALWVEPRRGGALVEAGRAAAGLLRGLPEHLRAFRGVDLRHPLAVLGAFERARPRVPHWYLEAVGVAPAGQGRGVGGALLRHRLALADAAGEPAYLESSSPRTGALYRRLGFVPLGRVAAFAGGGGPVGMWRPVTPP